MQQKLNRGKFLWHCLNEYHELTENTRFSNLSESVLASFNFFARTGNPDPALLNQLNATRLFTTIENVYNEINTRSIDQRLMTTSLASTNKKCNVINR